MYEFIPKEIIAAVDAGQVGALRQTCLALEDRTARRFNTALGTGGILVLVMAAAITVRPDLIPSFLQGSRLSGAMVGLGLGLLAATGACVYAWRQREKLLLAQASTQISKMERKCALRVVLRWWSRAKSVSDIPASFKDLAVRIMETRDLTLKDVKLYAKAIMEAGRIVGEYRRDYVFAQKLGLPLPGQAGLPSPERVAVPVEDTTSSHITVIAGSAEDARSAPRISQQEAASISVKPGVSLPLAAPASSASDAAVPTESSANDAIHRVPAPTAAKPVHSAEVVQFRAPRAERRLEPSQYQYERISARQLPSAALDVGTVAAAQGWSESHLVRVSLFAGLPREWPGDQQVRSAIDAMRKADWHTFILLTPHPRKLAEIAQDILGDAPHIWAGTTVSRQDDVAQRIPALGALKAAVRFVHVGLREKLTVAPFAACKACAAAKSEKCVACGGTGYLVNWMIAGGVSGPGATPIHINTYRQLRGEAQQFGSFTFAGWGDWVHEDELRAAGEGAVLEAVERSMSRSLESAPCKEGGYAFRLGSERPYRTLDGTIHNTAPLARVRAIDRLFAAHG